MRKCHYHRHPITYFCTHVKCTLPLCDQCLQIHSKQMLFKDYHNQPDYIRKIDQAKQKAITWLKEQRRKFQQIQEQIDEKLQAAEAQLMKEINIQFALLRKTIFDNIKIYQDMQSIGERQELIENGSLRELILAYEDISDDQRDHKWKRKKLKEQMDEFTHEVNIQSVKQVVRRTLKMPNQLTTPLNKQFKGKKGLNLSTVLETSDVQPFSTKNFMKVINTKDTYMSSPRSSVCKFQSGQRF